MKKKILVLLIISFCFFLIDTKVYASEIDLNDKINILDKKVKKKEQKLDIDVGKGYAVKCEDVKVLHKYWLAIEIITPILVILFGSIDFVISIMSSDQQKIIAARKKFPKRLIAGFGIFIAFTIVSIVVSISKNNSANKTTLIECIVNGE